MRRHSHVLKCKSRASKRSAVEIAFHKLHVMCRAKEIRSRGYGYCSSYPTLRHSYVLKCRGRASKRSAVEIAFHKLHVMCRAKRCIQEGTGTALSSLRSSTAYNRQNNVIASLSSPCQTKSSRLAQPSIHYEPRCRNAMFRAKEMQSTRRDASKRELAPLYLPFAQAQLITDRTT